MQITFVTSGEIDDIILKNSVKNCDVLVFSCGILSKIDLLREANALTFSIEKLCLLSTSLNCVVIAAADTSVLGNLHKSAIVIDKGNLLGVADMAHVIDETCYSSGANFRVFDTSKGKIGIIVGDDIFYTEVSRILTLCDSEILISLFDRIYSALPLTMLKAQSYANGIAIAMAAKDYVQIADIRGELAFASRQKICTFEMEIIKDYHLLAARRRGCYKTIN